MSWPTPTSRCYSSASTHRVLDGAIRFPSLDLLVPTRGPQNHFDPFDFNYQTQLSPTPKAQLDVAQCRLAVPHGFSRLSLGSTGFPSLEVPGGHPLRPPTAPRYLAHHRDGKRKWTSNSRTCTRTSSAAKPKESANEPFERTSPDTCAVTYPIARRNPWRSHDAAACAASFFSSNCRCANPAYYLSPTSLHSITFTVAKY